MARIDKTWRADVCAQQGLTSLAGHIHLLSKVCQSLPTEKLRTTQPQNYMEFFHDISEHVPIDTVYSFVFEASERRSLSCDDDAKLWPERRALQRQRFSAWLPHTHRYIASSSQCSVHVGVHVRHSLTSARHFECVRSPLQGGRHLHG